eukprot:CAMPEP_0197626004 /NCGR_PEP_ID=MMETSP1338-20131121/5180_1 /TAXON_ID=43686 ORGANISM="Pelagodinium beii, Strain RCC1491" /NCGR_SAMPLE_ID=MMETSP1338 /ASSEMBLY_ACC=CAM_ASM_000754 /LENGTH=233 /DNA_ID=CAMNT_0043196521 /DNA_START=15 /DNA_END=713 /DNA_ORIENTATION=-
MNRKVYDVTAWSKRHPGGQGVLLQMGGKDATAAAAAAHKSVLPANLMWEFCIGYIVRVKPQETKEEAAKEENAKPAARRSARSRVSASENKGESEVSSAEDGISSVADLQSLKSASAAKIQQKPKAKRRSPQSLIMDHANNRKPLRIGSKEKKDGQSDPLGGKTWSKDGTEALTRLASARTVEEEPSEVRDVDEEEPLKRNFPVNDSGLWCFMRRACWGPAAERAPSAIPPEQ